MAKFVDVYLLPLAEQNVAAYREMAAAAGKLFCKHGATNYREYVSADLKAMDGIMAFPAAVKLEPGEVLIYAAVEFESETSRNEAMANLFKDEEMEAIMPKEPLFEMKRMIYGGFELLVDE